MTPVTPILDGYSVSCTIPAKGPWDAVTFHYRPLLGPAVCEYLDTQKRGANRFKAMCKLLSDQVTAWDVKKPGSDDTVPVTEEHLARMPVSYIGEMVDAVLGYSALEQIADTKN